MRNNKGYKRIPDEPEIELTGQTKDKNRSSDIEILKAKLPSTKKPVVFNTKSNNISYTDIQTNISTIKSGDIAPFLREARRNGEAAWGFDALFQKMTGLTEFEQYIEKSPSTALIDYQLLRLGGHIRMLEGKGKTDDAQALSTLYTVLVEKLQEYEQAVGELANSKSRHQNEPRQRLVKQFQSDWQLLIKPIANKYKNQKDTYNILLNVATIVCTGGLALGWLFLKNLWRLANRKGLGLFQFEQAHSRKVENVQKLYDDVIKATAADLAGLPNYFSDEIKDADDTAELLLKRVGELSGLHTSMKVDETYDEDAKDELEATIIAFSSALTLFLKSLDRFKKDPQNSKTSLSDIQKTFMDRWNKLVDTHELKQNSSILTGKFPIECATKFSEIVEISQQFVKELEELKQAEHQSGRSSPSVDSQSHLI